MHFLIDIYLNTDKAVYNIKLPQKIIDIFGKHGKEHQNETLYIKINNYFKSQNRGYIYTGPFS